MSYFLELTYKTLFNNEPNKDDEFRITSDEDELFCDMGDHGLIPFTQQKRLELISNSDLNIHKASVSRKNKNQKNVHYVPKNVVEEANYDNMFEIIWREATALVGKLLEFPCGVENIKILKWTSELQSSGIIFETCKTQLKPLFTKTTEEKLYTAFKAIFKKFDFSTFKDDELPKDDMVKGVNYLLQELFKCSKTYTVSNSQESTTVVKPMETVENQDTLYYVIGYVLHKLVSPKSLDDHKKIGWALIEKNLENIPENLKRWTSIQDRGGLKYPNMEAFNIFQKMQTHVGKFYGKVFYVNKRKLVVEAVEGDTYLQDKWRKVYSKVGVCKEVADEVMKMFLVKYCNTNGKGHTNQLRHDFKTIQYKKQMETKAKSQQKKKKKIVEEVKREFVQNKMIV